MHGWTGKPCTLGPPNARRNGISSDEDMGGGSRTGRCPTRFAPREHRVDVSFDYGDCTPNAEYIYYFVDK